MRFLLLLFWGLVFSFPLLAQEETNKFQFHSASTSFVFYVNQDSGGAIITTDLGFNSGKNIFKLMGSAGSEINILGGSGDTLNEINLLYGREWRLTSWLYTDTFIGAGYFTYEDSSGFREDIRDETIGFPLQLKLRFKMGNHFGAGLQTHANFNFAKTFVAMGSFIQFSF